MNDALKKEKPVSNQESILIILTGKASQLTRGDGPEGRESGSRNGYWTD